MSFIRRTPRLPVVSALVLGAAWIVLPASAAPLTTASITQVHNRVTVKEPGQSPRPAQVKETVNGQALVATGSGSRAELKFADDTVTRLGANTVFTFRQGTRDMTLDEGTMLLRVPKNAGGAKITTAAVSAAITGTTVLVEANPPKAQGAPGEDLGFTKWIVLEGEMRVYINDRLGESRIISPGQMVILPPHARAIPMPVDIDLARLIASSNLVTKGPEKLESTDLIVEAVSEQEEEVKDGGLVPTNLIIMGKGNELLVASESLLGQINSAQSAITIEVIEAILNGEVPTDEDGTPILQAEVVQLPAPQEEPSEYQPLPTITAPNPFPIDDSTVIATDNPTIRTPNFETGVKNGTVYNTQVQGLASEFFFDNSSPELDPVIDLVAAASGDMAAYKFEELEILGNPEFITANGPDSLVLIGKNGITYGFDPRSVETVGETGPPTAQAQVSLVYAGEGPSPLDFSGLNNVMLLTEDGDIILHDNGGPIQGPDGLLMIAARGDGPSGEGVGLYVGTGIETTQPNSGIILASQGWMTLDNLDPIRTPSLVAFAPQYLEIYGPIDLSGTDFLNLVGGSVYLDRSLEANPGTEAILVALDGDITVGYSEGPWVNVTGFQEVSAQGDIHVNGDLGTDELYAKNVDVLGTLKQTTSSEDLAPDEIVGYWTAEGDIIADSIEAPNVSIVAGGYSEPDPIGEPGEPVVTSTDSYTISTWQGIVAHDILADRIETFGYGGSIEAEDFITALGSNAGLEGPSGIYADMDITSHNGNISSFNGSIESYNGNITATNGSIEADHGIFAWFGSIQAGDYITNYGYGDINGYFGVQADGGSIRNYGGGIRAGDGDIAAAGDIDSTGHVEARSYTSEAGNVTAGKSIYAESLYADGNVTAQDGDIIIKGDEVVEPTAQGGIQPAFGTVPGSETAGTLTIGGTSLSATGNIRADTLVSNLYEGTLTVQADNVELGDVFTSGGTLHVDARTVSFTPINGNLPANGVSFEPGLESLTLGSAGSLQLASDLGSPLERVQNITVEASGSDINGLGQSIYADSIRGSGSVSADRIEATNLAVGMASAENLAIGAGGIRREDDTASNTLLTLDGESSPTISSLGGIQYNHTNLDDAAGSLSINSTGAVNFGPDGINGANLNGANSALGDAGQLSVTAGSIDVANTQISANTAHASAAGGNITLESTQVGGTGIQIHNTAQIHAIMAAGATGPGGQIIVRADHARISVDGTLDASTTTDAGGTLLQIEQAYGTAATPIDILQNANLTADFIKLHSLGPDGTVNIHAGTIGPNLNANRQLRIFGGSVTGSVNFLGSGQINLNSPSTIVQANTIYVAPTARVNILDTGTATFRANNHNYINNVGPTGYGGTSKTVVQALPK